MMGQLDFRARSAGRKVILRGDRTVIDLARSERRLIITEEPRRYGRDAPVVSGDSHFLMGAFLGASASYQDFIVL
jgi:hypothetical protein